LYWRRSVATAETLPTHLVFVDDNVSIKQQQHQQQLMCLHSSSSLYFALCLSGVMYLISIERCVDAKLVAKQSATTSTKKPKSKIKNQTTKTKPLVHKFEFFGVRRMTDRRV
jgi:hypothetical protein